MSLSLKWHQLKMPNTRNISLNFLDIDLHANSFMLIFLILVYSTTEHLNHGGHRSFRPLPLCIFLLDLDQFIWSREWLLGEGCLRRWHLLTLKNGVQIEVGNQEGRKRLWLFITSHTFHFNTQTMTAHNKILSNALHLSKKVKWR